MDNFVVNGTSIDFGEAWLLIVGREHRAGRTKLVILDAQSVENGPVEALLPATYRRRSTARSFAPDSPSVWLRMIMGLQECKGRSRRRPADRDRCRAERGARPSVGALAYRVDSHCERSARRCRLFSGRELTLSLRLPRLEQLEGQHRAEVGTMLDDLEARFGDQSLQSVA